MEPRKKKQVKPKKCEYYGVICGVDATLCANCVGLPQPYGMAFGPKPKK